MKKQILSSLKRILCIGLALNIIYTSVDFSALNVWAEEEITAPIEDVDPNSGTQEGTKENPEASTIETPKGELSNEGTKKPEGETPEINLEGTNLPNNQENQGDILPNAQEPDLENEEEDEESFLKKLGGLLPLSLAPLNEGEEEGPDLPIVEDAEGIKYNVTVTLDGSYADLNGEVIPVEIYMNGRTESGELVPNPIQSTMTLSTQNGKTTTGTITDIPVYINKGTGDMKENGSGEYTTPENFYKIKIGKVISQNRAYTFSFSNDGELDTSYVDLKIRKNDKSWSGTTNILHAKPRDSQSYEIAINFLAEDSIDAFPFDPSDIKIISHYTLDNEPQTAEYSITTENIEKIDNSKFKIKFPKIIAEEGQNLELMIPSASTDKSFVCYKKGETGFTEITSEKIKFDESIKELLFIQTKTISGDFKWLDNNDHNKGENLSYRVPDETLKSYIRLYNAGKNQQITDFNYEKNVKVETITDSESEKKTTLSISNVPIFNTNGWLQNYYFKLEQPDVSENEIMANDDQKEHVYKILYDNGTNSTITAYGFENATVMLTLHKKAEPFEFTVKWLDDRYNNPSDSDGTNTNKARKAEMQDGITMYLWRYAVTGAPNDAENAAPVYDAKGNQYALKLDASNEEYTKNEFKINRDNFKKDATEEDFPHYDENGVPYVYYATIVDSGNGYKIDFPGDSTEKKREYIKTNETLQFIRNGKDTLVASIDWKAKGETDYQGAAGILEVQRRLAGTDDEWQSFCGAIEGYEYYHQETKTEKATMYASSEHSTLDTFFMDLELYDELGRTYEFRVIENGIKRKDDTDINKFYYFDEKSNSWTKLEDEKKSWDNTTAGSVNRQNPEQIRFIYQNHGYKADALWENNFYYDETTNQIDLFRSRYRVTNTLYDTLEYKPEIRWNFNGISSNAADKEHAGLELEALLQGKQIEKDGYKTLDYTGQSIEYYVARNKKPYGKIVVKGENGQANYYFYEWGTNDWSDTPSKGPIPIKTEGVDSQHPGNFRWFFEKGLDFPQYDENGNRYSYAIGSFDQNNEFSTENFCHDHNYIETQFLMTKYHYMIRPERDPSTTMDHPIINHNLAVEGKSYRISVKVNWKDDLTDIAVREVDAHIVALRKIEDEYYLFKDMGALVEGDSDKNGSYRFLLNVGNDFEGTKYYEPLTKDEIVIQNDKLPENLKIDTTASDFEEQLYYTVIQYSFQYGNYKMIFPDIEEGKLLKKEYLLQDAISCKTPLDYNPANPVEIYMYSYDADVSKESSNDFNIENSSSPIRYHHKVFYNTLNRITTDLNVVINWEDDSNSSKYRKDKLIVQLYQTIADIQSPVKDETGKIKTIVWTTPDNGFNQYAYKADNGLDGIETTNNFIPGESTGFTGLPITTEDGKPITYSIKQYAVPSVLPNGETIYESDGTIKDIYFISDFATEKTTQNNYYAREEDKGYKATVSPAYKLYHTIEEKNTAVNLNYTADFYIVWHDEDAYKAGSRSDMKYTLYYSYIEKNQEETATPELHLYELSNYNSVLDTADTSGENPFYQKISFYGLTEYIHGRRVHYYVQEVKPSKNDGYYQYQIDYYDVDNKDLQEKESVYGTKTEKHRGIPGETSPKATWSSLTGDQKIERGYYIGQDKVIVNSLTSTIRVQGTKKWVNLAADAQKPDCDIYLFRTSIHDTENEKPVPDQDTTQEELKELYQEKQCGITTLNTDKTEYHFKDDSENWIDYPKFDHYGASYTYTIGEIIHGADGKAVAVEIMEGSTEGNMLLTNTYDKMGKNVRDITITKQWFNTHKAEGEKQNPVAKFYIYRMECKYIEDGKVIIPEMDNIDYQKVIDNMPKLNEKNRSEYKWDAYLKGLAAAAKTEENTCKLVHTTTIKQGTGTDSNQLKITGLKMFAPNGCPYIYFVVEDKEYIPSYTISNSGKGLSDTGSVISEDNEGDTAYGYELDNNVVLVSNSGVGIETEEGKNCNSDVMFSNRLKNEEQYNITTIKGSITWDEGDTKIGNKTVRPDIDNVQNCIKLTLQNSSASQTNQGNAWGRKTVEYTKVTWEYNTTNHTWDYTITGTFPQYAENGQPYTYYVTESLLSEENSQKISENYKAAPYEGYKLATQLDSNDPKTLKIPNLKNTLRGTYTVEKEWKDGYNSYNMRPKGVLVMLQYQEQNSSDWNMLTDKDGKTIVLELNSGNDWKNSFSVFPFTTRDGKAYKYRAIEVALKYEKAGTISWTNTTDLVITAGALNLEDGRYSFDNNTLIWNFKDSGAYQYTETIDGQSDNTQYRSRETFGSYRVYPGVDKDGVTFSSSAPSHTTSILNRLEASTGFRIIKKWENDDEDRFHTRPEKIQIKLQKKTWGHENYEASEKDIKYNSIYEEFNKDGWEDIETTKEIYITKNNIHKKGDGTTDPNTWELELQDLPMYDDEGYRIAYRAFEVGNSGVIFSNINNKDAESNRTYNIQQEYILGNYKFSRYFLYSDETGSTNNIVVEFTNTLNTIDSKSIYVDKDWILKDESTSGDSYAAGKGYQSTVQAVLTYSNGDNTNPKTAQLTSDVDLKGTDYRFTWNKIPAYAWVNEGTEEAPNYQRYATLSNIDVKEIKTKLGAAATVNEVGYTDHSVQYASDSVTVGTFTAGEQDWLVKNTKGDSNNFTITNTPLTKHSLEVRYTNDENAEKNYQTRPNNAFVKLQYRVEGESDWKDVDDSIKSKLLNTVKYSDIKIENANATPTPADEPNYKAVISHLPEYVKTDSDVKKYQYRIVETDVQYGTSTKLTVPYDTETSGELTVKTISNRVGDTQNTDRTVAGYTYTYDSSNSSVTKLEKSIELVTLKGSKVWDDQSDKFNTRPKEVTSSGVAQADTSSVKVTLKKGTAQTDVTANTTVTWKDIGSNNWSYETTQVYPKYATGTDTYETYAITEAMSNQDYEVSYGESATTSTRDSISGKYFNCTEITNKLKKKSLEVEKHWPNLSSVTGLSMEPVSVTYTVQKKLNGETNNQYTVLNDSSNNPITVTLEYSNAENDVSKGTISELPLCNLSGNTYDYRVLETEVKVIFKDSSSAEHEVTYKLDLEDNKIKEFIGTSTTASKEKEFNTSVLNTDTFTYQIGPFDAKYEKTDSAYKYTNSIHTATASADIEWSETKVGETALDATLIQKFRPDQLDLVLQRKVKGSSSWDDVTEKYLGSSNTVISVTNISKENTTDAAKNTVATIEHLPIFVFDNNAVKEYEYRIVEKEFAYNNPEATGVKCPIIYTGGITSDFDGTTKELTGSDTVNTKAFYNCSNKNVTADGSYEYKTEIKNKLKSGELINLVDATLSGTVLWKDNADVLQKRPDGTEEGKGVSLRIKAKKGDTNETYEHVFTMGNTAASTTGSTDITIQGLDKTNGIKVSWKKDTNNNWNYTITGLPMFDKYGNYLTYSICSEKNPIDYDAKADNSNTSSHKTDKNQKYAFGIVTEFTRGNYETTKINHVDFVENMTTKLFVTKIWDGDETHYWQTRPDDLYVALQYKLVNQDGNSISGSDWQFWDKQSHSLGTAYPSDAENWTEEFAKDIVVNSPKPFYKLHKPSGDGSSVTKWEYEATLPQFAIQDDGTYQFIQYRVVEIGKNKSGNLTLLDETNKPSTTPNMDDLYHIGSYYMNDYVATWTSDTGYSDSTITNKIDTRQSITVKKLWQNTVQESDKKSVKVKLIGMVSDQEGHVTNVESIFEHELPIVTGDNKTWEFTYEDLPQYNLESQTVTWHVEEILVDNVVANDIKTTNGNRVVATTDGNWIGFYGEDTTSGAGTENRIFTVTNIPATSAKLTVNYADDLDNVYGTRFTDTKAVLQYRVKGNSDVTWQPVTNTNTNNNLADQIIKNAEQTGYIDGVVSLENDQIVISQQNSTSLATYEYAIKNLPKYYDKDATEELEYRLVEIQQGTNISVSYSDASENAINASVITNIQLAKISDENNDQASAGYEYLYTTNNNNQSDAVLTKTLKRVYIPGTKTWEDQDNAHNTRPAKENGAVTGEVGKYTQNEDSAVKITVLRAGSALAHQPAITWKTEGNASTNVWTYRTDNLPKYMPQQNEIAQYTVEESCTSSQYASQVSGFNVTNTLHIIYVEVEKVDAEDNMPLSGVKFGLYPYTSDGNISENAKYIAATDENGKAVFQVVEIGMYYLKETKAPIGYEIVDNPAGAPLNLSEEFYSKTVTYKVEDPRKLGELTIYKKDGTDTTPLNDVKFEVYKKQDGNFIQTMWWFLTGKQYKFHQDAETDLATGTAKITDIPWGEYYIVETETNTGYVLSKDKYYFKVNAETVEHPIKLWSIDTYDDESKKITENTITNYKNKFYFQKKAVGTPDVLAAGSYEIHRKSTDALVQSFTLNDSAAKEFEGFAVGEYYIKEVTAPINYAKAENLYFSITDIGEIKDASGQVIADQTLVMEDMPLCSFKVTKQFTGDTAWKKSIRPSEVEIQLYAYRTSSDESSKTAVGTPKKITVNTTTDTYNYTFENLPMYEVENGTAHALSYIAEEVPTGDTMYTVSYSAVSVQGGTKAAGCTYEETITNEIDTTDVQNIFISKENVGGPEAAEFDLQVTFWKVDTHKHFYIDSYDVGTWNDGTKDIDSAVTKSIGQDGMLKIKHGKTVRFTLPKDIAYSVEEIFTATDTPEYEVEKESVETFTGNKQRTVITNTKQVYTAINNTTENLDNTGSKQTNAGGTVAVIEHTSDDVITENPDKVDYTAGKYCVHWTPKKDWENENTFTIKYKDTADGEEKEITVSNFLDKDGNLIPAYGENDTYLNQTCYAKLHARYSTFTIKQHPDTKEIYLYLSDDINGMPYLNQVNVEFVPTIAVANITEGRVGGGVKIEKDSDYKPNSEGMLENQTDGRLSHKTRIYAQAEEGYYIDLRETELGLVGKVLTLDMRTHDAAGVGLLLTSYSLAEDMPLLADGTGANKISLSGNRFSKTLQYDSGSYTLTGGITILESKAGNNPTKIVMEVDELSIPIDIGIVFKKYVPKDPNSNAGGTEENEAGTSGVGKEETAKTISALTEKDGVAPKTGDDNSLYVWYLLFLMSLGYILNDYLKTRSKKDQ